jgi:hypothetical protein
MLLKIKNITEKNIKQLQIIRANIYSTRLNIPIHKKNIDFLKKFIDLYGEKSCIEIYMPEVNLSYRDNIVSTLEILTPTYIELNGGYDTDTYFLGNKYVDKSRVILSGIRADHDMDPSWILFWNSDFDFPEKFIYEIELIQDLKDPFNFLLSNNNPNNDGLGLNDFSELTINYQILFEIDIFDKTIFPLVSLLPNCLGIAIDVNNFAKFIQLLNMRNCPQELKSFLKH